MLVQLLYAAGLLFAPIGDKVEGNYLQYLNTRYAIVETWTQADTVAEIARHEHFDVLGKSPRGLLIKLNRCKDLRLHLARLGSDAAVDRIYPFPLTVTAPPDTKEGIIANGPGNPQHPH